MAVVLAGLHNANVDRPVQLVVTSSHEVEPPSAVLKDDTASSCTTAGRPNMQANSLVHTDTMQATTDDRLTSSLSGQHMLLVSHRATALIQEVAQCLIEKGAHVTLALRHTQDGHYAVKHILKLLPPGQLLQPPLQAADASSESATPTSLASSSMPLNMANLSSIKEFAAALNADDEPLDLVLVDSWDLYAAGTKDHRWYTKEGLAGTAQTAFLGPAVLLHLLQPKLAFCGAAVLLTASPSHRLASLDDLHKTLTSWGHSTPAATQAALLAYVRRLALQLHGQGVKAGAVDLSVLSEQPLKGSLIRKLPVLHQALHTLLPSAHDAAQLLADVAAHLMAPTTPYSTPAADMGPQNGSNAAQDDSAQPHESLSPSAGQVAHTSSLFRPDQGDSDEKDSGVGLPGFDAMHAIYMHAMFNSSSSVTPSAAALMCKAVEAATGAANKVDSAQPMTAAPAGPLQDADRPSHGSSQVITSSEIQADEVDQAAALDLGSRFGHAAGRETIRSDAAVLATVSSQAGLSAGSKPFSYISRGLLASPLVTALDHSGRSTLVSRTLHTLTSPLYDLASTSLITTALLADWPVRALLLAPAGLLPSLLSHLGPLGAGATQLLSQLQRLVPGVVSVPADLHPGWVEVLPSGPVLDDKLGWRLWHLVEGYASLGA